MYLAGSQLVGRRHGKITVLAALPAHRIRVQCECGSTKEIGRTAFYRTQSCGCARGHAAGVAARRRVLAQYKSDAASRGLVWALSDETFDRVTSSPCMYCGTDPSTRCTTKNGSFVYNGIDRVNNGIGYLPENVVPCCRPCNRAKDVMSVNDFIGWVRRVARHTEGR